MAHKITYQSATFLRKMEMIDNSSKEMGCYPRKKKRKKKKKKS